MKNYLFVSAVILIGLFACNTTDLKLIQNGSSEYEIIIPQNADSVELKSSDELQKYLQEISGVSLAIRDEDKISSNKRIFIGNTIEGKLLNAGADEIIIKARDNDLFILGGDSKSHFMRSILSLKTTLDASFMHQMQKLSLN